MHTLRRRYGRLNQKYSAIDKSLKEVALQVIKIQNGVIKMEDKNDKRNKKLI